MPPFVRFFCFAVTLDSLPEPNSFFRGAIVFIYDGIGDDVNQDKNEDKTDNGTRSVM